MMRSSCILPLSYICVEYFPINTFLVEVVDFAASFLEISIIIVLVLDIVWKVSILYRRLNHLDSLCDIRYKSKKIARVGRI